MNNEEIRQRRQERGLSINPAPHGEIKEFWVVMTPTPDSTLVDICFRSTPQEIHLYGLRGEDVVGFYLSEDKARGVARRLLKKEGNHLSEKIVTEENGESEKCDCIVHRYHVAHICECNGEIFAHSQAQCDQHRFHQSEHLNVYCT